MALERLTTPSLDPWSREDFGPTFGFEEQGTGFSKAVNGRTYSFDQVRSAADLQRVVDIQRIAWGWSETELAPTHILSLMDDTAGGVFAARDEEGKMIGFAAGFGGGKDTLTEQPTIISSMLAMAGQEYRSVGIGRELKIVQAHYAKLRGYSVMKWFYDPERGENASLNLRKLGARAEEFWIDKYGEMQSSLYGSVPTDRFRAVWRFTEPSTINRILGITRSPTIEEVQRFPIATQENMPDDNDVLVQISADIDKEPEGDKIKRRFILRTILRNYFNKGYIAAEFITGHNDHGERLNYYLLKPASDTFHAETLQATLDS